MAKRKIAKSAVTGKIVSRKEAEDNPATTFLQTVKVKPKAKPKPKKPAAKKPPARRERRDPARQKVFDLGRLARRGGIRRDDSPCSGAEGDLWREGWDFQDKA